MDDAGCVSSGQSTGDLRGEIEHFAKFQRRVSHALAQRYAFDKFSCYEVDRIGLVDLMYGDDVGMIQRGRSLRFLDKASHAVPMSSHLSRQNLQRNFPIKFRILGQINFTHPARAEWRADLIAA